MKKQWSLVLGIALVLMIVWVPMVYAEGPTDGRAGRAELRFMEGMIDHHQMALDMAADCLANASTETVTTLCQNIITAQTAEIETMQGWLLEWYNVDYQPMSMEENMVMMSGMDGMEMESTEEASMEGMPVTDPAMMMGMMAGLNRLEGVDYDIAFLESMIDHHSDAIHMSERLIERVPTEHGHAELRDLAHQIIEDQTAEIESMEGLLTDLSN